MKYTPQTNLNVLEANASDGVVDSNAGAVTPPAKPAAKTASRKTAAKKVPAKRPAAMRKSPANGNKATPPHGDKSKESAPPVPNDRRVDDLLATASELYEHSKATDQKQLDQRLELGGVLIKLKDAVGHGNFMKEFRLWTKAKRIRFSLKTGQRAMAYAELKNAGKFDTVSNLADAERLRKDEAKKKKAEELAAKAAAEDNKVGGNDDAPVKLTKAQVDRESKQFAKPVLERCRKCDAGSRQALLEELIELLTKELERCN